MGGCIGGGRAMQDSGGGNKLGFDVVKEEEIHWRDSKMWEGIVLVGTGHPRELS